jgi:exo-beta-1,3-glucanase (GH17 family)
MRERVEKRIKDKVIVHVVVGNEVVSRFKAYVAKLIDDKKGVLYDGRVVEKKKGRWVYEPK